MRQRESNGEPVLKRCLSKQLSSLSFVAIVASQYRDFSGAPMRRCYSQSQGELCEDEHQHKVSCMNSCVKTATPGTRKLWVHQ